MLEIGYTTRDGLLRIVDVSQSREGAPIRVTIAENIGMKSFRGLGERRGRLQDGWASFFPELALSVSPASFWEAFDA